ncbi:hypothetical protein PF001_g31025 [Phytophthora fragariae]|uniref:Aminotransferase class I/classII domain-containing protein n=1 Tax=Phytophthora fragariae TaxID=53985 RepID=A0A6A4AWI5_9STRA|nr:hypothetical protein PF001_g31025 [Phytophthora fragariae]
MSTVHHYPPADFQPVISHLNESLSWKQNLPLLLMGNGASELIDLSALTCLVNPANPAGDKYGRGADEELHRDHVPDDPTIIVNKITQPWVGPQWRQDSAINSATHRQRRIALHAAKIMRKQMPWSVTLITLAFVSAVVKDDAYLEQTSDACNLAKKHGVAVRSGKPGYNFPAFLRIAIRSPKQTAVLHRVEAAVRRVPDGAHPMGGHTSDTQLANAAFISDRAISPAASNGSNENDSCPEVCTATEINEMKKQFEQQAHEIGALKQ